ncbi:Na(+)/h(+) exchange regulatory cofactor nhe-rf1 [Plakobranchus ocellatus]|uniref:Na(+)/h(+) exchange regulatory cofactor nhe-rf1 n=1 Tax=Plakobranchus ocellatus TaxID=259542 RepID=A0AAV4D604_9GAST|nr:Na(+)/h(+) exchange regulatory cofactor nhe-rf1 [Plakobranchus ocellatus]
MSSDVPEEFRPRLCHVVKWSDFPGYGFNLHAEKGKAGQFIGQVDDGSPAQAGGLKEGDRIVEVNGVNIGNENHQQVVTRIKSGGDETRLLVVDIETDNYYKEQKKVIKGDLPEVKSFSASRNEVTQPEPEPEPEPEVSEEPPAEALQQILTVEDNKEEEHPPQEEEVAAEVTTATVTTNGQTNEDELHRPRLCHLKIWPHFQGYGFNLHAERNKPGQYIGLVDDNSPALAAGLRVNDRIVEVNGVNVENQPHPEVISRIKAVPNETRLLVVDRESDAYYKERGVTVHSGMPQVDYIAAPDAETAASTHVEVISDNGVEAAIVAEEAAEVEAAPAADVEVDTPKEEDVKQEEEDVVKVEDEDDKEEEKREEPVEENKPEEPEEEITEIKEEEAAVIVETTPEDKVEEPVNGGSPAPVHKTEPAPAPEPEFAVAPAPEPTPAPAPAPASTATNDNMDGLELNLSVAEMKERLKQRKKQDPRSSKMTFEQKYKDFQRM